MESPKATSFFLVPVEPLVGQPTINSDPDFNDKDSTTLADWTQDQSYGELDFSTNWTSFALEDGNSLDLFNTHEDPNSQNAVNNTFLDQQENTNPQSETRSSHGWETTLQNKALSSNHVQTHESFANLPLGNFDYSENAWEVGNLANTDLDQFFQQDEYNSAVPQIVRNPTEIHLSPQRDSTTAFMPEQQRGFGVQPQLVQPTSRQIHPLPRRMGPQPLPRNGLPSPARPFRSAQIEMGPLMLPANEMQLSNTVDPAIRQHYGSGLQPSSYGAKRDRYEMRPAPHMANRVVFRAQPPLFGVLEPVFGKTEWEWRPVKETQRKNNRSANIEQFDPTRFYQPIVRTPRSFGSHKQGDLPPFRYNGYGELLTKEKFSSTQIYEYLTYHPLHYSATGHDSRNSRLILWIQNVPADSYRRYPNDGSDKCRFEDCPAPNHTIFKGFFRVAFDELSAENPLVDPFHCAGFVHLYCLEKFCDFPSICRNFNVQPDVRRLPEGTNKMAITRDYREMQRVVDDFIASAANKAKAQTHEESLGYLLTMQTLKLEPPRRKIIRKTRVGNTIDYHRGNVTKWVDAGGVTGKGEPSYDVDKDTITKKRHHSTLSEGRQVESGITKKRRLELEANINEPIWDLTEMT